MSDNGERKKFRTLKLNLVAAILADSDLSSSATRFASAVLLKWFHKESDECFASYDTIAEVAGMKRRATAIKAAQELEEAKWLKIEKRGRGKGGRSNTNRFIFDFDRIRNGTENVPLDDVNGTLFAQNGTESVPDPFLTPSDPSGQKEGERGKAPPAGGPPAPGPRRHDVVGGPRARRQASRSFGALTLARSTSPSRNGSMARSSPAVARQPRN
jgi:hypothetical protein